jgi:hypothetical protein
MSAFVCYQIYSHWRGCCVYRSEMSSGSWHTCLLLHVNVINHHRLEGVYIDMWKALGWWVALWWQQKNSSSNMCVASHQVAVAAGIWFVFCILYYYFSPRSFDVFHGDDAIPLPPLSHLPNAQNDGEMKEEKHSRSSPHCRRFAICHLADGDILSIISYIVRDYILSDGIWSVCVYTLYWSDPWVIECPSSLSQTNGHRVGPEQEHNGCVLIPRALACR